MAALGYSTFVAPEKPVVSSHVAPGETRENWSPTSATLIYGDRDAVLVDGVAATGKNLTTRWSSAGRDRP